MHGTWIVAIFMESRSYLRLALCHSEAQSKKPRTAICYPFGLSLDSLVVVDIKEEIRLYSIAVSTAWSMVHEDILPG
jgi:hypothetical protein